MSNRIIKSRARGSSIQLIDCLSSLLTLELFSPGEELYLISPWLSNVPLIDNRHGQFRAIAGEYNKPTLYLVDILRLLAERGTAVRVLYLSPAKDMTSIFLQGTQDIEHIEHRGFRRLHEKGLITPHFYLRGSMNFTYSGINLNQESVELTTDEAAVWQALQEAQMLWEGGADHGGN